MALPRWALGTSAWAAFTVLALAPAAGAQNAALVALSTRVPCHWDERLVPAAQLALREGADTHADALHASLEAAGLAPPTVQFWVGRGEGDALLEGAERWLTARAVDARSARCAGAVNAERGAWVLVPRSLALAVETPGPQAREGTLRWAGRALTQPRLLVQSPQGTVLEGHCDGLNECSYVLPGAAGAWRFQVLGDGGSGLQVWAAGTLGGGPRGAQDEAPAAVTPPTITSRWHWLGALNTVRGAQGVGTLRSDPLLGVVAQARAEQLARAHSVVHSAQGEGPVERLRSAGLGAERLGENVVRAPTLTEAVARLEGSPAHRSLRRDGAFEALGLGVIEADDGVYVVELLAQSPRLLAP